MNSQFYNNYLINHDVIFFNVTLFSKVEVLILFNKLYMLHYFLGKIAILKKLI